MILQNTKQIIHQNSYKSGQTIIIWNSDVILEYYLENNGVSDSQLIKYFTKKKMEQVICLFLTTYINLGDERILLVSSSVQQTFVNNFLPQHSTQDPQ